MQKLKLDLTLQPDDAYKSSLAGLKAGDALLVVQGDGGQHFLVTVAGGLQVGTAPADVAAAVHRHPDVTVKVRSLRKAADGSIGHLQVRVESGGAPAAAGTRAAPSSAHAAEQSAADESGFLLSQSQLQRLKDDAQVVAALSDPRLQGLLTEVEGSRDRERALEAALQRDDFREFSERLLCSIAGGDTTQSGEGHV